MENSDLNVLSSSTETLYEWTDLDVNQMKVQWEAFKRSTDILTSTVLTPVWPCKTEVWFFIDDSFRTPLTICTTMCDIFMEIDVFQQTIVWKRIWYLSSGVLNCFFSKQHLLNIDFECTVENMSFSSSIRIFFISQFGFTSNVSCSIDSPLISSGDTEGLDPAGSFWGKSSESSCPCGSLQSMKLALRELKAIPQGSNGWW